MKPPRITTRIIKDLNRGTFQELKRRMEADKRVVKVGIPSESTHEPDGTSLALIGAVHEFGSPSRNIPERSFLRSGIRIARPSIIQLNRLNLIRVFKGEMSMGTALGQMGNLVVGAVKRQIRKGTYVPIKPATIRAKGSSKPLIDTGQMMGAVTYIVEDK